MNKATEREVRKLMELKIQTTILISTQDFDEGPDMLDRLIDAQHELSVRINNLVEGEANV